MARRSPARLRTLLLAIIVFGAVPALAGVLHSSWRSHEEALTDAAQDTLREASDAARRLGSEVEKARLVLTRLARHPGVQQGDSAACTPLATDALSMDPDFRNVGVTNAAGVLFCSGDPKVPVGTRVDERLLREASAAPGLFLREFPAGAIAPQPVLACLLPFRDAQGRPAGVAFVTLDFRSLADLAIGTRLPRGSTVTLVDGEGTIVLRDPDRENWMGLSIAGAPLWQQLQQDAMGRSFQADDLDGTPRLFGAARIRTGQGQPDAVLLIGVPEDAPMERPTFHLRVQLAGLAAALVLLAGVAWFGVEAVVLRPVRTIGQAAQDLSAGRLDARSGARGARELAQLGQAFDDMAASLQRSLGDTQHALDVLRDNHGRLSSLSRALIESQEAERSQIARELHDEVGQALTAATLDLDALRQGEHDPQSTRRIEAALDVVKHALDQVRELSLDLHPSMLDDLGLAAALQWYLTRQSERSGVETHLRTSGLDPRLPSMLETTCFRIAQEAITNVLRHARAQRIEVSVERLGDRVELRVRDDGVGFDAPQARQRARQGDSLGLLGMEERAALLGGKLEIASDSTGGSEVRAVFPIAVAETGGESTA